MDYNFLNEATITFSRGCIQDSVSGYEVDLSINGQFDGWDQTSGVHTYGCWDNFLFGTFIDTTGYIGRNGVFSPLAADDYYYVKIALKYNPAERKGSTSLPTKGKIAWRTVEDSTWDSDKEQEFDLNTDNSWHEYILNLSDSAYWVGTVNDLRIYPAIDGRRDDEFFIRSIKIVSLDTYVCRNTDCSFYSQYSHPCQGIGNVATYTSAQHEENAKFNILKSDILKININSYGNEYIRLNKNLSSADGNEVAKELTREISRVNVGGYSEAIVKFENNKFVIYGGTTTDESTISIVDGDLARQLKFYDSSGNEIASKTVGETPATGFEPINSFNVNSFLLLDLFDNDLDSEIIFDPFLYSIEGGRNDWLENGLGYAENVIASADEDTSGYINLPDRVNRDYNVIGGSGKTVIDVTHPFNASGRIKKLFVACTLDDGFTESGVPSGYEPWEYEYGRTELSSAKIKIFRPLRNGRLKEIESFDIPNRDRTDGKLYSVNQQCTEVDCDVWVNKGDLIGVYGAYVYVGKSLATDRVDAVYYEIAGEKSEFNPGRLKGEGGAGLPFYGRSNYKQRKMYVEADLGARTTVQGLEIFGETEATILEYNIASCADITWDVDLFGGQHRVRFYNYNIPTSSDWDSITHDNIAYGTSNLDDTVRYNTDGIAADSYSAGTNSTLVPTNPRYFFVNGDGEWVGVKSHIRRNYGIFNNFYADQHVVDFERDPIAFTLTFPYQKSKTIYKAVIYFKERYNFRNFALSTSSFGIGDADIPGYQLIPKYNAITLDGKRITEDSSIYSSVNEYLFKNPTNADIDADLTGGPMNTGDGFVLTYYEMNNQQTVIQAANTDWQTIAWEWDPIECYGFRLYCDYHKSTKIYEMEVYGAAEEVATSLIGGITVRYSYYGDIWWDVEVDETNNNSVTAFIGDTPRYLTFEIEPLTSSIFKDIHLGVGTDDLYVGEKGCEYQVLTDSSKIDATNTADVVYIKNIYDGIYDLEVDIAANSTKEDGLVFYSRLNNDSSIINPEVGADARYYKEDDFELKNENSNCAINCPTWGLHDLKDGKNAYYAYDEGTTWFDYGVLTVTGSLDFYNIPNTNKSRLELPSVVRARYWKFGPATTAFNVFEVSVLVDGTKEDLDIYYNSYNKTASSSSISNIVGYLKDNVLAGDYVDMISFYDYDDIYRNRKKYDSYVAFDLGSARKPSAIEFFHESVEDYSFYAIDDYDSVYLRYDTGVLKDFSYKETTFEIVGSGIDQSQGALDFGDYYKVPAAGGLHQQTNSHHPIYTTQSGTVSTSPAITDGEYFTGTGESLSGNNYLTWGLYFNSNVTVELLRMYMSGPSNTNNSWKRRYGVRLYTSDDGVIWTYRESIYIEQMDWEDETNNADGRWSYSSIIKFRKQYTAKYFVVYFSNTGSSVNNMWWNPSFNNQGRLHEMEAFCRNSAYPTAISFSGYSDSYVKIPDTPNIYFGNNKRANISMHIKANSLPANDGDYYIIARKWKDGYIPDSEINNQSPDRTFIIMLINRSGTVYLEAWAVSYTDQFQGWVQRRERITFTEIGNWHFVQISTTTDFDTDDDWRVYFDGYSTGVFASAKIANCEEDIKIGEGFDGVVSDFRITLGDDITQYPGYKSTSYQRNDRFYGRYYEMSAYISEDNLNWFKAYDVDFKNQLTANYYDSDNFFNQNFNTYFSIDLEHRHDIDIIRSYGDSDKHTFDEDTNTWYSNIESSSPLDIVDNSSTKNDARWVTVNLLNGDGTTRVIRKVGIYPDITRNVTLGGVAYNCEWDDLGTSLTNYSEGTNVAFGASVSGTSEFSSMPLTRLTDGIISDSIYYAWGSDEAGYPEFVIDLAEEKSIYRVKIYHGYDDEDTNYMVTAYDIYYATASGSFTQIFSITGNSSFERTHDLVNPVTARYIKIDITDYDSGIIALQESDGTVSFFSGAVMREIQVMSYYGYPVISSEDYPIVAIDLRDQFYLYGHELIGINTEDTSTDWSNYEENFAYSDEVFSDPNKVTFTEWGQDLVESYSGGILRVGDGQEYSTIAGAIAAASTGSMILIEPGTYSEGNFTIDKQIHFVGNTDNLDLNPVIINYTGSSQMFNINIPSSNYYDGNYLYIENIKIIRSYDWRIIINAQNQSESLNIIVNKCYLDCSASDAYIMSGPQDADVSAYLKNCEIVSGWVHEIVNFNAGHIYIQKCISDETISYYQSSKVADEEDYVLTPTIGYGYSYGEKYFDLIDGINQLGFYQWVAVKRNTATNLDDGPDYLKNLKISALYLETVASYSWWWNCSLCTLSNDYSHYVKFGLRALKIEYPASSNQDDVYYIEDEGFGIDEYASWRDGLNFRFRIDNINNLDLDFGYFYFVGKDDTNNNNDVEYRWNLNTISGALNTGWVELTLPFKYADDVIYTEPTDPAELDPRRPDSITFNKLGLVFRGKGNVLTLHIDGFKIKRCVFDESMIYTRGLYLTGDEYLIAPVSGFDGSKGTVEFWLRPDYNIGSDDYYYMFLNRCLFHFASNSGDMFGAAFTYRGLEVYRGNLRDDSLSSVNFRNFRSVLMDTVNHLAFVISNDGTKTNDGSTIQVYLNNRMILRDFTTWTVYDKKYFTFVLGGKATASIKADGIPQSGSLDAVISDIKLYNYCKSNFNDSFLGQNNVSTLTDPSEFIEISKDNVTFYKVGDTNLPLEFKEVSAETSVPVYIRSVIPDGLTGDENRTATILTSWKVTA